MAYFGGILLVVLLFCQIHQYLCKNSHTLHIKGGQEPVSILFVLALVNNIFLVPFGLF